MNSSFKKIVDIEQQAQNELEQLEKKLQKQFQTKQKKIDDEFEMKKQEIDNEINNYIQEEKLKIDQEAQIIINNAQKQADDIITQKHSLNEAKQQLKEVIDNV